MKSLAIIPARGGSRSILHKNIHPLGGKPLIAYTIENARLAVSVNRIIVSTDDTEIANVSKQYGAEVVWRPEEICGDSASSEAAILHVIEYLHRKENYEPDLIIFLQCTSPLTIPDDIDGAVQALLREKADTSFSITPFHYFLWRRDDNGNAVGINHDKFVRPLRQELDPQFIETGAVYVMRTEGFIKNKHRFFGKTAMYIMPSERFLEIDEPFDIEIAEILMRKQQECQKL